MANNYINMMMTMMPSADEPNVGIFWFYHGQIQDINKIAVSQSYESKTGLKTMYALHKDYWSKMKRRGGIYKKEYWDVPRGRVFYNMNDDTYEVMTGSWINSAKEGKDVILDDISYYFNIPKDKIIHKVEEHWEIGHGFSEEYLN